MKFIIFTALLVASASASYTSLSAGDQQLIKDAWAPISGNLQTTANTVFYNYLSKYPANQDKFETLKGKPLDDVKGTENFSLIAGRIFAIFDNCVKNIGNDKAFQKIVYDMSRPHVSRPITQGSYNDLRGVIYDSMHFNAARKFFSYISFFLPFHILFLNTINRGCCLEQDDGQLLLCLL
jgi:hypothetical protein